MSAPTSLSSHLRVCTLSPHAVSLLLFQGVPRVSPYCFCCPHKNPALWSLPIGCGPVSVLRRLKWPFGLSRARTGRLARFCAHPAPSGPGSPKSSMNTVPSSSSERNPLSIGRELKASQQPEEKGRACGCHPIPASSLFPYSQPHFLPDSQIQHQSTVLSLSHKPAPIPPQWPCAELTSGATTNSNPVLAQ